MFSRQTALQDLAMLGTAATMWDVWLPMTRTLSGQSTYAWGEQWYNTIYDGNGLRGDYLFLILLAVIGLSTLFMGLRNPRAPFPAMMIFWHGLLFTESLFPVLRGGTSIFQGDTGGVAFDFTLAAPIGTGVALALGVAYALSPKPREYLSVGWSERNTILTGAVVAVVGLAAVLEWTGVTHGLTDQIVVPMNILTPILIFFAFYPWRTSGSPGAAGLAEATSNP